MKIVFALIYIIFLTSCTSVSITDRKQLMILGDDIIYPEAFKAYKDFKSKTKLIESGKEIDQINNFPKGVRSVYVNGRRVKKEDVEIERSFLEVSSSNYDISNIPDHINYLPRKQAAQYSWFKRKHFN